MRTAYFLLVGIFDALTYLGASSGGTSSGPRDQKAGYEERNMIPVHVMGLCCGSHLCIPFMEWRCSIPEA